MIITSQGFSHFTPNMNNQEFGIETSSSIKTNKQNFSNDITIGKLESRNNGIVEKKLTIIFLENTSIVAKEKYVINRIVKTLIPKGLVCIINYGTTVRKTEVFEISNYENISLICEEDISENACLYEAIMHLLLLIYEKYMHIEENKKEKIIINKFEIIGFGTCKDNFSKVEKQKALDYFSKLSNKSQVITKYFCITENNFLDAAEIGFRSIGVINRNY